MVSSSRKKHFWDALTLATSVESISCVLTVIPHLNIDIGTTLLLSVFCLSSCLPTLHVPNLAFLYICLPSCRLSNRFCLPSWMGTDMVGRMEGRQKTDRQTGRKAGRSAGSQADRRTERRRWGQPELPGTGCCES